MMFLVVGFFFLISILCSFSSSIHGATDPADVSALNVMFGSLNYPYQLTKWRSNGGDPCGESWKGVTCSGSAVTEIKISGLGLTGSIGYQLTSMTSLTTLDISNNNLGNQVPYNLPPNLTQLNIAGNAFNGGIPYSISLMTGLIFLNASHNQFQNQLDDMFGKLSALSTLDFSFNSFPGILPESFSLLLSVSNMFLENNQFTGTIDVLANLPLKKLNIANNRFTGWIPQQLKKINLQTDGNSFNAGAAPPPPPGTPASGQGNWNNNSGNNNSPSNSGGGNKSGIGGGVVAGIVISLLVVGAIIAFFLVKRRSRKPTPDEEKLDNQSFAPLAHNELQEMKSVQTSTAVGTKTYETPTVINLRPPPVERDKSFGEEDFKQKPIVIKKVNTAPIDATSYSIADLQVATGSFSVDSLIGEGSFGHVYRAQFDDGKVLAVKKINSSILHDSEDFIEIVSNMSRLHHPNIAELVGYCSEHRQHLLVHEFHKNGSLHDFLHLPDEYTKPLIWNTRVKIALGIARALE